MKIRKLTLAVVCMAAAVADYTPCTVAEHKIKKGAEDDLRLPLSRTTDILAWLGGNRIPGQFLCGFSMETQDMVENSRKKLVKKQIDMIAANNLRDEGAGFGVATNLLTLITAEEERALPLMSKEDAANELLTEILARRTQQ